MTFKAVRDALIALTDQPGRRVAFSSIVEECKRRGTEVTRDSVAADAGTMHDYGLATKHESTVTWDGVIATAPNGDKAAIVWADSRYPMQHFERIDVEVAYPVHFYVVPRAS